MASKPRKPAPKPLEEPRLSRGRTRPGAIFPVVPPASALPETYAATLQEIKTHLRNARIRAILAANPMVIEAYCQRKKPLVAEYALRGLDQSIAVAAWQTQLTETLPEELRGSLPTIKEIEAELAGDLPPISTKQGKPHD